jgi:uncharacterized repeat protein (TIGR03803 family)
MSIRQVPMITDVIRRAFQLRKLYTLATRALIACVTLSSASIAQTVADLHSFTSTGNSQYPYLVTPAQGRNGDLYGTTTGLNYGSIFRLQTTGAEADLFAFDDTDGYGPSAGVTLGTDGNFYGTTLVGGSAGYGVLFKITPSGTYTVLHDFLGESDGLYPRAAPIEASNGNLYGTTQTGADFLGATVYEYTPAGAFNTIYQFENTSDYNVTAPLVQGPDGNLYGTTYNGGANGCGSIFKLTTSGALLMQYSFDCAQGGANPAGPLLLASDGNYYGTTYGGSGDVAGGVFRMSPAGSVKVLHTFTASGSEGQNPDGGLVQATDGNLYGSTKFGGSDDYGTLYQITTSGAYTQLYSFVAQTGEYPTGSLLQHTNGLLYGTAYEGGAYGYGAVYSLNMVLGPFVTFVRPSAATGGPVQILGQGLTGTTAVTFNGVEATTFSVVSDTYMTAVVPSGATTGPVVVTTTGGALTSNVNLRVRP